MENVPIYDLMELLQQNRLVKMLVWFYNKDIQEKEAFLK